MPEAPIAGLPIPAASGQLGKVRDYFYYGFTFRNTSALNSALIRLWAGTQAGDPLVVPVLEEVSLAPSESARELYPAGVRVPGGIFMELVSGAVEGAVRIL